MVELDGAYVPQFTPELSDEGYALADAIELVLEAEPQRWFVPSEIARKVKADTVKVRNILHWMVQFQTVECDRADMNSRAKYRNR